jgi:tetratricopeptide (TPR) repeat protein
MDSIYREITILGIVSTLVGVPCKSSVVHAESLPSESLQPLQFIAQQSAQGFFKQAFNKYQKGDYQGAIADLNQAIRIDPHEAKFYYSRGLVHRKLLDSQAAIADYTLAIQFDPNFADAYYNRGNAYLTIGDEPEATKDYQKAANLYLKQGKLKDSQDALDRVRRLLP